MPTMKGFAARNCRCYIPNTQFPLPVVGCVHGSGSANVPTLFAAGSNVLCRLKWRLAQVSPVVSPTLHEVRFTQFDTDVIATAARLIPPQVWSPITRHYSPLWRESRRLVPRLVISVGGFVVFFKGDRLVFERGWCR